jgi:transposase
VLTAPSEHKVLDILPFRNTSKLQQYFLSFNREERKQVKTIVMDMSNVSRSIAEDLFPCARIVANKYPVTHCFTEGTNNKIKVLKKVSHGIKIFKILRNRVLFSKT